MTQVQPYRRHSILAAILSTFALLIFHSVAVAQSPTPRPSPPPSELCWGKPIPQQMLDLYFMYKNNKCATCNPVINCYDIISTSTGQPVDGDWELEENCGAIYADGTPCAKKSGGSGYCKEGVCNGCDRGQKCISPAGAAGYCDASGRCVDGTCGSGAMLTSDCFMSNGTPGICCQAQKPDGFPAGGAPLCGPPQGKTNFGMEQLPSPTNECLEVWVTNGCAVGGTTKSGTPCRNGGTCKNGVCLPPTKTGGGKSIIN